MQQCHIEVIIFFSREPHWGYMMCYWLWRRATGLPLVASYLIRALFRGPTCQEENIGLWHAHSASRDDATTTTIVPRNGMVVVCFPRLGPLLLMLKSQNIFWMHNNSNRKWLIYSVRMRYSCQQYVVFSKNSYLTLAPTFFSQEGRSSTTKMPTMTEPITFQFIRAWLVFI